jgi:predicted dehydrogenase
MRYVAKMKFALLGADEATVSIAEYLAGHADHELVAVYEPGMLEGRLSAIAPAAVRWSWEALLHEPVADAVIVAAGPEDQRSEQLRALAKAGVAMLIAWPTCDVVTAYELEMIRRDTQSPLMAYIPGRLHPAVMRLAEMARQDAASPIGRIEQAAFERASKDRDRRSVLRLFTQDVALLRAIVGDLNKVSAMGPSSDSASWGNLSVQMTGAGETLARWSMQPVADWSGGRLVVLGAEGKATLEMPDDAQPWTLTIAGQQPGSVAFDDWSEPKAVIEAFVRTFHGEPPVPAFQEACRDVETAATVERSLARGKTIELYDEEVSEEATFKGIMAVGGCGMLMLGLLAVLVAAAVEGLQLPFRHHILWRLWPAYLLAAILFFLLLQPLRLVFRSGSQNRGPGEDKKTA